MHFILIYILFNITISQLSVESTPQSIIRGLNPNVPTFNAPQFNLSDIKNQDFLDTQNGAPYKFGHSILVDINFFDFASCDILNNGDKVYRLKIKSSDAYSINFIFNQFYLHKNTEFFIYNNDYSDLIGAFTNKNNKTHNRFSTAPISGEEVILEYFEPSNVNSNSIINISNIIHGYKPNFSTQSRGFDDSQSCNNNINCSIYESWENQKNSVVMTLTDGGTRLCSGTMLNNINEDLQLYFLTSYNCLGGHEDWIFMFNYESLNCNNEDGITNHTLSGATLLSYSSTSDFALLKINEPAPLYYDIYLSGWDARPIVPSNCASIHHPVGDIKKISFDEGYVFSDGWFFDDGTHWRVDEWVSGITEPGSYGAPLFNDNYHLVGQLHGGQSLCENPFNDYYGKFSQSWNLGPLDSTLKDWLDPDNTNLLVLDGIELNNIPEPDLTYTINDTELLIFDTGFANSILTLNNIGEDDSILDYTLYHSPFSNVGSLPDEGQYYWIDSKNNSNYNYYWEDISESGNLVSFQDNDVAVGPFAIGFDFPFYGELYSEFIINPNGWIGFGPDNEEWDNIEIPSNSAPLSSIMAFWDDLNPINFGSTNNMSGEVKFLSSDSQLIVSYEEVVHWGDNQPYSFQIILHKNGLIDINYSIMDGNLNSATIGIQNQTGEIGHQIIYNNNYIENNLRLSFQKADDWITIDNNQHLITGSIDSAEFINHNIIIDGNLMDNGYYTAYIYIDSNALDIIKIPLYIQVGYQSFLGDTNYDGILNVQDIIVLISMVTGNTIESNEADINQDGIINILDAILLVSLIIEF